MNMSKRDCNGWVLCPSQRLPGKFYFFNTLSGEAVWSLNELEKRTARQNDIQHVKWLSYPEPDCPPEEPTTNPWQPKRLSSWGRQTPSFGQVAFPKYTPNLGPTMTPNICSNISSNMPNHMGPSTNQIMAPHMTVLGGPNDTYINMPYPIPLSMMNHDWQRNFEPNMPYWSPEMDGPTSGVPKRFFRYENPINKIGESSYNKNNWIQQQMCNKRQVFGQKQNNDSNCPTVINDQNAFGLNRDIMSGKKSVFNTNNKQIFKETWRQPDVYNAVKHTFGRLNSSEDFELPCVSQKSQKIFPNANVRYFNGNSFAYQPDNNYIDIPKVSPQKLAPLPITEMIKLSKSMENLSNFKENTNNFVTPQKSSDIFRSYGNSKSMENLSLKDSRLVQKKLPTKLNVQLFPTTGSSFTETNTTIVESQSKFTAVTDKVSPQKRHISENDNSELTSKSPKVDDTSDLRHFLIAKRRKLDSIDTKIETGNKAEGKKIKTHYSEESKTKESKKRVTFDLGVEDDDEMLEDTPEENTLLAETEEELTITTLRNLGGEHNELWYIVADTDALLDEDQFIEQLVTTDDKCCLLVPFAVKYEIDALCVGDCRGRPRVMTARQMSRRLAAPPAHIVVQNTQNDETQEPSNPILDCCFQAMEEGNHVVLITNNIELYEKAISNDVFCYKLQKLKDGIVSKPELSFEVTKIQKPNTHKKVEHLVFQVPNDYKPSASGKKDQIYVNCSRKRLFEDIDYDNRESQNSFLCNNNNFSSKSFNANQRVNYDDETTSELSRDITRLNLTDSFEFQNEPKTKDHRFEKENMFSNGNFQTNSYQRKHQVQNEMRLADEQIENVEHSEFEKKDSFLTENRATEKNQLARREFKSINGYTIESHLKKFVIRSEIIEERLLSRIDEWICCFTQSMEDVLAEILQKHNVPSLSQPPWSLQEGIDCIKELFNENNTIKIITQKLSSLLYANSCTNSKIKTTILPNSFMRMFGCCILLIKSLKSILPDSPEILDGENNLEKLLQNIESTSDEIELSLKVQTPVVSRSELIEPHVHRRNFVKKQSMVEEYLCNHFPAWQSKGVLIKQVHKEQHKDDQQNQHKIIRTNGKDLNLLKIDNKKQIYSEDGATMKLKPDSKIKKKLQNMKESFEISKENIEKPTGAKLIKKLAVESLNLPPKMREIDVKKRESASRDMLNMIDNMLSKEITRHYDISSILVDQDADPKIIDTNVREDEITTTPKSPTLPKPRINMLKKVQALAKIDKIVHTNAEINDKSSSDNKNPENEVRNNKLHDDETNVRKNLKLIDIFDENLNNDKNNEKEFNENEKFDMDVLDYSEMDVDSTIHDDASDKSNNDLQIDENHDVICSDSVENTSRSSRKKVTSTSNDIGVPNNENALQDNDNSSPDNDNSTPNNDNSTPNNDNSSPDNDTSPPSNDNSPPNNVKIPSIEESSPNNGNNVVDSTQSNGKPFDNDAFQYNVMMIKMFLAQLSISFNSIYDFIVSTSHEMEVGKVSESKKTSVHDKADKTHSLLTVIIDKLKKIIERESSDNSPLKEIQIKIAQQTSKDKRITRYKQVVAKCVEQAQILQQCLRSMVSTNGELSPASSLDENIRYSNIFADE